MSLVKMSPSKCSRSKCIASQHYYLHRQLAMCGVIHTNAHLMNSCGFASSRLIHLRYTHRLKRSLEIAFDLLTGEPSMAWKRITFFVLVPLLFAACVPQQKYDDLLTAYRGQEQTLLATQSDLQTARTNEERLRAQMAAAAADLPNSSRTGMHTSKQKFLSRSCSM